MKPCPICQIPHCTHERKFYAFGLVKLAIIQKSLDTTVMIFSKLATFLPTNSEMQIKLSLSFDELTKCQERIADVKRWCETKAS
jgi:hypothetical protein